MRKPKHQKLNDCFEAYQHMKQGTRPGRRTKDGSIPTHPVVPVQEFLTEKGVLIGCLLWLKRHRVFHNRHDCGTRATESGVIQFGIKDSGDIHGILPNGIHFEIECKRGKGGRLSKGQQNRIQDIRANNGVYLVVHGVDELEWLMKGLI